MLFAQPHSTRPRSFQWTPTAGWVDLIAAALCLVPTIGFLLAWHMQVDLLSFTLIATVPALACVGLCGYGLIRTSPIFFNRLFAGLVGGLVATVAFDALRFPATTQFKGVPDYVPLIGQHLLRETIGIAPSVQAVVLGYGYHYLLTGALLGVAYSLVSGRGHRVWGLLLGVLAGLGFIALPQFRLLSVAEGFNLDLASLQMVLAFTLAGGVLGAVVRALGQTKANVLSVVFLREAPIEAQETLSS
jgi:hypothetical protein